MVEFLTKLLLVARSRLKSRARLKAENMVVPAQNSIWCQILGCGE